VSLLSNVGEQVGGAADFLGDAVGDAADTAGDVAGDVAGAAGDAAGGAADTADDVVDDTVEGAADVGGDIAGGAADIGGDVVGGATDIADDVAEAGVDVGAGISGGAADIGGDVVSGAVNAADDAVEESVDVGGDIAGAAGSAANDAVGGAGDAVGNFVRTTVEESEALDVDEVEESIQEGGPLERVGTALSVVGTEATDPLKGAGKEVVGTAAEIANPNLDVGELSDEEVGEAVGAGLDATAGRAEDAIVEAKEGTAADNVAANFVGGLGRATVRDVFGAVTKAGTGIDPETGETNAKLSAFEAAELAFGAPAAAKLGVRGGSKVAKGASKTAPKIDDILSGGSKTTRAGAQAAKTGANAGATATSMALGGLFRAGSRIADDVPSALRGLRGGADDVADDIGNQFGGLGTGGAIDDIGGVGDVSRGIDVDVSRGLGSGGVDVGGPATSGLDDFADLGNVGGRAGGDLGDDLFARVTGDVGGGGTGSFDGASAARRPNDVPITGIEAARIPNADLSRLGRADLARIPNEDLSRLGDQNVGRIIDDGSLQGLLGGGARTSDEFGSIGSGLGDDIAGAGAGDDIGGFGARTGEDLTGTGARIGDDAGAGTRASDDVSGAGTAGRAGDDAAEAGARGADEGDNLVNRARADENSGLFGNTLTGRILKTGAIAGGGAAAGGAAVTLLGGGDGGGGPGGQPGGGPPGNHDDPGWGEPQQVDQARGWTVWAQQHNDGRRRFWAVRDGGSTYLQPQGEEGSSVHYFESEDALVQALRAWVQKQRGQQDQSQQQQNNQQQSNQQQNQDRGSQGGGGGQGQGWGPKERVDQAQGWTFWGQAHPDGRKRFWGVRDGGSTYLQPDGKEGSSIHYFDTTDALRAAFEKWSEKQQSGRGEGGSEGGQDDQNESSENSEWSEPQKIDNVEGWKIYGQTHPDGRTRFFAVGQNDEGQKIYLQPEGQVATEIHYFGTKEKLVASLEEWVRRRNNGETSSGEDPTGEEPRKPEQSRSGWSEMQYVRELQLGWHLFGQTHPQRGQRFVVAGMNQGDRIYLDKDGSVVGSPVTYTSTDAIAGALRSYAQRVRNGNVSREPNGQRPDAAAVEDDMSKEPSDGDGGFLASLSTEQKLLGGAAIVAGGWFAHEQGWFDDLLQEDPTKATGGA